jgi:hypothetical protein
MRLRMGRSGGGVEDFVNSGQAAPGLFGAKEHLVLRVFGKGNGEVSELGWKVGVEKENTHRVKLYTEINESIAHTNASDRDT